MADIPPLIFSLPFATTSLKEKFGLLAKYQFCTKIVAVTTPHSYSCGLLSSTGLPTETVPDGRDPAIKIFFTALTSRSTTLPQKGQEYP
jgi:hypothetical protein